MALAEVKAFFEILTKVSEKLVDTSNAYNRASNELKAFPDKVAELKLRQQEWESLLQKYTLPSDHPVLARLVRASKMLLEEQESFDNFQKGNCCLIFCTKVTFPSNMIANLDGAVSAFDGVLQGMKDTKAAADLLREEANKRLAPFPFSMDEKYVPIMETVNDIKAALASDHPSGTMVLLHGESGRGKSTMAKYLALTFQNELKQGTSPFPGGIYFLACEKSTNKLLLMQQLWQDLGFGSEGSNAYPTHHDISETLDGDRQEPEQMGPHKFEFDNLRRKVMAELELRDSRSMRMLIIIDNVLDRDVINALRIPYKHVKYLVTSQRTYPDMSATVRLAKPSLEEARQILRKHSGTWTEDTPLDPQVQIEVDGLIKQADFNSLVLANLGAFIKGSAVDSNSKLEQEKLRELKQNLYVLLNHMDEDTLEAAVFLETYKQTIEASMTLVLQGLCQEAKTMVYLMVLCEDLTVDEIVLKVWFHRLYGKSAEGEIKYSSAVAQLKTQSIILFESKEVLWRQEPWSRWSIHELRRQFIREKRHADLKEIMEKLVQKHSEEEDDDLIAVLCLLHGDATCYKRVLSVSGLQVHSDLREDAPWSTRTSHHTFIKSFDALLHPTAKDKSWQKESHKAAKQVMLCAVKSLTVKDLDKTISRLLRLPETDLAACYALQSYSMKSSALQEAVRVLAKKIHKYVGVDINSHARQKVKMYLQALGKFNHDQTVPDLPESLLTLLQQQSEDVELPTDIFLVLDSLTWESTAYTRRIASIPDLLQTLVSFLDKDKHPDLFRLSIGILYNLLASREGGVVDHPIRASFAAIPNSLQYLIDLSPFAVTAVFTLCHLVRTTFIAEKIASTPAIFSSFLLLLSADKVRVVRYAVRILRTLSEASTRTSICASSEALKRLVELVNEDTFIKCHRVELPSWDTSKDMSLSRGVANVIIMLTNSGKELEAFLTAALRKYVALLADGVNVVVQFAAVGGLEHLAFEPAICKILLQTCPDIGNQLLRLMNQDADATSFNTLVDAFHTIVIKSAEAEDSWTDCANKAIKQYVVLLGNAKLQGGAARALSKLALKVKTCRLLDSSTVQKLVGLIREGTSSSTIKYVTHTIRSILVKENVINCTEQRELISGALKRYVALLDDGVETCLKSESARALGVFASFIVHRNLIVEIPGALQKLAGIIRIDAIPSLLVNVAYAVNIITVRGTKLEDPVDSFFSKALELYASLLAVNVEEKLREAAVRALGKLAFNEIARKLFCRFPDAVQRLVGLLKGPFADKPETLGHLAVAINELLLSGEELEGTRRAPILSEVLGQYISLLSDGVDWAVQLQALKALASLCVKDDARRYIFTLPRAVDRIVGLLDQNVHANHAFLIDFAELVVALIIGGTNLADKATITFFLDVIERLIQLLAQVDGAEWPFTRSLLRALEELGTYPTISRVIFSHPDVQVSVTKLLVHDGTPPSIFLKAVGVTWCINFKRSHLEDRITLETLSNVLGSYITQQSNMCDVHTGPPCQQVAARILDNLTSEPANIDQVMVSPMLLVRRLVRLLETNGVEIPLLETWFYLTQLNVCSTQVDSPDHEFDGKSELGWVKWRSEALNNYVRLVQKSQTRDYTRSVACKVIALLLEQASDRNLLVSECPSISEQLLATFAWSEEASILQDIEYQQSAEYKEDCTSETMRALTLINPSTADQIVLSSTAAYRGRAVAKLCLKMYESALLDIDRAVELRPHSTWMLRRRAYIRAQVSDNSGASSDLCQAVNLDPADGFSRCELGVFMRIMGNLDDALEHLNLAVDLSTPDMLYDPLRQRGYVKYLLGDEAGATADADKAMLCKTALHYVRVFYKYSFRVLPTNYLHFAT